MSERVLKALAGSRRAAESRMLDVVSVTRGEGGEVLDPVTDEWVTVPAETVYAGRARVRMASASADVNAASQLLVVSQLELHVPVGVPLFMAGDTVTVTGCPTRPDQVGRVFVVAGPFDGSQSSAIRYKIEAADSRG